MHPSPTPANSTNLLECLDAEAQSAVANTLARLNMPVFPIHSVDSDGLCSCGRNCGGNAGKHPRTSNGFLDATCDGKCIDDWWTTWPDANIGVATGAGAGIWVLDIDSATGGSDTLAALEAENGELEPTWCVETGGGGFHLWYRYAKWDLRNSVGLLGPGLDVRAEGGYVIVPPSRHRSGAPYKWARAWHPTQVNLAQGPAWLIDRLTQASRRPKIPPGRPPYAQGPGAYESQLRSQSISEGERNATLTRLAGSLRRSSLGEGAILAALLVENAERCQPPLPEAEVARIARSIATYPVPPDRSRRPSLTQQFTPFAFRDGKVVLG